MVEDEHLVFEAEGTRMTLSGQELRFEATNGPLRLVWGRGSYTYPITEIAAVELKAPTALSRGRLRVAHPDLGVVEAFFTKKGSGDARRFHEELLAASGADRDAVVEGKPAYARSKELELAESAADRSEAASARQSAAQAERLERARQRDDAALERQKAAEEKSRLKAQRAADLLAERVRPDHRELLERAAAAAAAGDIDREEQLIHQVRAAVQRTKVGRDLRAVDAELDRMHSEGLVRIGATRFGRLLNPNAFDRFIGVPTGDRVNELEVWSDRVIADGRLYMVSDSTVARLYLDGEVHMSTRPSLTTMAALAPLPGSALAAGLAMPKKEFSDHRTAELHILDSGWSVVIKLNPGAMTEPRRIAERLNATVEAASRQPRSTGLAEPPREDDLIAGLERIGALLEKGVITDDEAAALKRRLLDG